MRVTASLLQRLDISDAALTELARDALHQASFEYLGSSIALRFQDAAAATLFAGRYGQFPAARPPERTLSCAEHVELGLIFWWSHGDRYAWPLRYSARRTAFLADALALRAVFGRRPDVLSLHGAAVSVGGRVAAIVAGTNGGKTTTAIACALRGMTLYSDERCVLVDGRVLPFPRALNLRRDSAQLLGLPGRVASGRREYVRIGDIVAFAPPPPAPLAAVFVIDGVAAHPTVTPVTALDLMPILNRRVFSPLRGVERMIKIMRALAGVRCYRLTLGPPYATAAAVECAVGDMTNVGIA